MSCLKIGKKLVPVKKAWRGLRSSLKKKIYKLNRSEALNKGKHSLNKGLKKAINEAKPILRVHKKRIKSRTTILRYHQRHFSPVYVEELFSWRVSSSNAIEPSAKLRGASQENEKGSAVGATGSMSGSMVGASSSLLGSIHGAPGAMLGLMGSSSVPKLGSIGVGAKLEMGSVVSGTASGKGSMWGATKSEVGSLASASGSDKDSVLGATSSIEGTSPWGVDLRAEAFISRFREEMQLQRQRSIREYAEMLARGI
ncbi:uncharacterized protein LOC18447108 [Amborella trichopoda]|uniref:DUF4408 domain-containing protein n=1 Tax=Amborella trichopoda TaxID=13333 RepID=U5CZF0_AMBTC|nr:uncharacterized protein LOC18447108 [Amborella trichopoda]ERN18741.1 hypothetical protein AMTR_s00067p00021710 [Amborella trichopoda]|eukprot:XP_006857274.1 uncharacterized protein LOC18447108 [Amborella trichopoda]